MHRHTLLTPLEVSLGPEPLLPSNVFSKTKIKQKQLS